MITKPNAECCHEADRCTTKHQVLRGVALGWSWGWSWLDLSVESGKYNEVILQILAIPKSLGYLPVSVGSGGIAGSSTCVGCRLSVS